MFGGQTVVLIFWVSAALILYVVVGYPLLLALLGRLAVRPVRRADITPSVSVVVAAHNEESCISGRIENVLNADYPQDKRDVIIASDGSNDATVSIAKSYESDDVLVLDLPRRGKVPALHDGVQESSADILVFSDANMIFEPSALKALVRPFADEEVGGVVGNTRYGRVDHVESASKGESAYWSYDKRIKAMESRIGSVVSAHGGLYAIRRSLYVRPLDSAATDDFMISTAIVKQGRRLVYEHEARAWEPPSANSAGEFGRRVRLMTRGWHGVGVQRQLLNPFRHGWYSVVMLSHKVLRRLVPLAALLTYFSSLLLAPTSGFYLTAAWVQTAFFAIAAVGGLARKTRIGRSKVLALPFFACLSGTAAIMALINVVRRRRIDFWHPQRAGA